MIDAGWSAERQIDVDEVIDTLKSRGFLLTDKNIYFLKKYGLLEFELENRNEIFKDIVHKNFNPLKAIGKNLYKESLEYLEDEYDIEGINTVIPIGENYNGNMLILCTEDNVFYGYTDGCLVKYGNTIPNPVPLGDRHEDSFQDKRKSSSHRKMLCRDYHNGIHGGLLRENEKQKKQEQFHQG